MSASTPSSAPASAPAPAQSSTVAYKPRYIDIGINLTDAIYTGIYHSTPRHASDLSSVISRAQAAGCRHLLVTGSDLVESGKAVELSRQYPGIVYNTVGVHPCSCLQFKNHDPNPESLLQELKELALKAKEEGQCVAFGEIGLDYDRLGLCDKETQLEYFAKQLDIACELDLPLFLHSRAAHADFVRLLNERKERLPRRGVVHSFTGTVGEMRELVSGGWYIGVNGCSLKTEENLEVVRQIPLDRLMLETDGPWCEMRPSHASAAYCKNWEQEEGPGGGKELGIKWVKKEKWVEGALVKGRNESCLIGKVAWAVAGIRRETLESVCEAAWRNTVSVFGVGEK